MSAIAGLNQTVEQLMLDVARLDASQSTNVLEIIDVQAALNAAWLLLCSMIIFCMQIGFAFLEAGGVRRTNTSVVVLKNFADFAVGIICFWFVGFGLLYGDGLVVGGSNSALFMVGEPQYMVQFFGAAVYATATSTILSGAIASRMKFVAYLLSVAFICAFAYPVAAHWAWGDGGWLKEMGFIDFAGSGPIHLLGGVFGLVGAKVLGPRQGIFEEDLDGNVVTSFPGSSLVLSSLGCMLLWFGWFAFNAAAAPTTADGMLIAANCVVTTMLASSSGIVTITVFGRLRDGKYDFGELMNGLLAALVCVTAGCATITPLASLFVGMLGVFAYRGGRALMLRFEIDDVLGAFPVHGAAGFMGVCCAGFFANPTKCEQVGFGEAGCFTFKHIGVQCLGAVAILAWSLLVAIIFFLLLDRVYGIRVSANDELCGLDFVYSRGYVFRTLVQRSADAREQLKREKAMLLRMNMPTRSASGRISKSTKIERANAQPSGMRTPKSKKTHAFDQEIELDATSIARRNGVKISSLTHQPKRGSAGSDGSPMIHHVPGQHGVEDEFTAQLETQV